MSRSAQRHTNRTELEKDVPRSFPADQDVSKGTPNFDRIAGIYRWMELASFGPWLWWCRCAFLGKLSDCRRALVLGDGDGRFTAQLLRTNPDIRVEAVDSSPAMLRSLLRRAGASATRVHTRTLDVRRSLPGPNSMRRPAGPRYDLVITHFFLDCLTTSEVRALAATLRTMVAPGALWVVSEFAIPPNRFGRFVAQPLISALYRAFGWLTGLTICQLPDHRAALEEAGFSLGRHRAWLRGLLVSELWIANPFPVAPIQLAQSLGANVTNVLKSTG
jgi:hypothetical protein